MLPGPSGASPPRTRAPARHLPHKRLGPRRFQHRLELPGSGGEAAQGAAGSAHSAPPPAPAAAEGRTREARGRREPRARHPPAGRPLGRGAGPRAGRVGCRETGSRGPGSGTPVRGPPPAPPAARARHSPGARRREDRTSPAAKRGRPPRRTSDKARKASRTRGRKSDQAPPLDFRLCSRRPLGGRGFRPGARWARKEGGGRGARGDPVLSALQPLRPGSVAAPV